MLKQKQFIQNQIRNYHHRFLKDHKQNKLKFVIHLTWCNSRACYLCTFKLTCIGKLIWKRCGAYPGMFRDTTIKTRNSNRSNIRISHSISFKTTPRGMGLHTALFSGTRISAVFLASSHAVRLRPVLPSRPIKAEKVWDKTSHCFVGRKTRPRKCEHYWRVPGSNKKEERAEIRERQSEKQSQIYLKCVLARSTLRWEGAQDCQLRLAPRSGAASISIMA